MDFYCIDDDEWANEWFVITVTQESLFRGLRKYPHYLLTEGQRMLHFLPVASVELSVKFSTAGRFNFTARPFSLLDTRKSPHPCGVRNLHSHTVTAVAQQRERHT